jgi:sulfhydrogenase subunit delta
MTLAPKSNLKPKVAVYKFSSCDGCQLTILNLEDELLDLASVMDIAYFLEATRFVKPGPYDVGIVEGSITTPHEADRIKDVRAECKYLIALGTCATAGGIQAPVDLEIWGCPVNKSTVIEVLTALLQNRKPNFPPSPVCLECKRRSIICVAVAQGIPCLGPVVHGGCGALCPASGRGCYGCFGPSSAGNFTSLVNIMVPNDRYPGETANMLRSFSSHAPAFRVAADAARKIVVSKEIK